MKNIEKSIGTFFEPIIYEMGSHMSIFNSVSTYYSTYLVWFFYTYKYLLKSLLTQFMHSYQSLNMYFMRYLHIKYGIRFLIHYLHANSWDVWFVHVQHTQYLYRKYTVTEQQQIEHFYRKYTVTEQ